MIAKGSGKPGYFARVLRTTNAVGREYIIDEMTRKNTTVSRQDIIVVLDLFREMVCNLLGKGFSIKTDLFNAHVSIKGSFENEEENYTPGKHRLKLNLVPDQFLTRTVTDQVQLRKVNTNPKKPEPSALYDFATRTTNTTATPGRIAELRGQHLYVDTSRQEQGIWFINTATHRATRAVDIDRQTNSRILFTIPAALEAGTYRIELRSSRTSILKTSSLESPVTVTEISQAA